MLFIHVAAMLRFARENGLLFLETSAKSSQNVEDMLAHSGKIGNNMENHKQPPKYIDLFIIWQLGGSRYAQNGSRWPTKILGSRQAVCESERRPHALFLLRLTELVSEIGRNSMCCIKPNKKKKYVVGNPVGNPSSRRNSETHFKTESLKQI